MFVQMIGDQMALWNMCSPFNRFSINEAHKTLSVGNNNNCNL